MADNEICSYSFMGELICGKPATSFRWIESEYAGYLSPACQHHENLAAQRICALHAEVDHAERERDMAYQRRDEAQAKIEWLLTEIGRLKGEIERLRGPFPCCEHCAEDPIHAVEEDGHTVACDFCQTAGADVVLVKAAADEYREGYEAWKEQGQKAMDALLEIWHIAEPNDTTHATFGMDPQRVVAAVRSAFGMETP